MNLEAAKEVLTGDDLTLDGVADLVLKRIAQFMGECASDESFCAMAVDEKRDQSGKLLSLTLVACDDVSGEPVRRVVRG